MGLGWLSKLIFGKKSGAQIVATYRSPTEGDKLILEQLRKMGADLEQPREVLNYLYVPTREALHRAAAELREDGYEVAERESADAANNPPNPWLVLATKTMIVNSESVETMRARFEKLATESHGDYDGWEAAATP